MSDCPCLCHTALGEPCSNTCCETAGEIRRPATLMEVFADDPHTDVVSHLFIEDLVVLAPRHADPEHQALADTMLREWFELQLAESNIVVGSLRVNDGDPDPFMDALREAVERQPRDDTGRWVPCDPPPCPPLEDIDLDDIFPLDPPE